MTKLLEQAFEKAAGLPDTEQDSVARWLLAELESDARWSELFAGSQDQLAKLAEEALAEHARGETTELDPDRL
ncbi:MAG TPA: hypothetical protein VGS57_22510 [Thermoanaerobaculia bacterium]|jgi:hypothetical protein|nr:hypothetical protein [Thermoanaerobaculia bacterium]